MLGLQTAVEETEATARATWGGERTTYRAERETATSKLRESRKDASKGVKARTEGWRRVEMRIRRIGVGAGRARSAWSCKRVCRLRSAWELSSLVIDRRRGGKTSGVVDVLNERGVLKAEG